MQKPDVSHHPSSYRDPSGFIFEKDAVIYRQVNLLFKENFDHFLSSGCYEHLQKNGLLIPHQIIEQNLTGSTNYYRTLKPEKIDFISYPYEWSFDMLKDAALLTLTLVRESLAYGMILKDATPYNIQWHRGKLIFIDTLSFEKYNPEKPWIAYRQFCECFLNPLLLMHYSHISLHELQLAYPEGISVSVTSSLLPWRSRFSFYTLLHVHLHNRIATGNNKNKKQVHFSAKKIINLIKSLESLIKTLHLKDKQSTWSSYYAEAGERSDYLEQKKQIIAGWLEEIPDLKTAADLGANEGVFSKLLTDKGMRTIAADFDPYCINRLYKKIIQNNEQNLQPLIIDIANPSPAIGVNNKERLSFIDRTKVDLVLALALIHHLAIGKNIPFERLLTFFNGYPSTLSSNSFPRKMKKCNSC